jgi:hypothetical protein
MKPPVTLKGELRLEIFNMMDKMIGLMIDKLKMMWKIKCLDL